MLLKPQFAVLPCGSVFLAGERNGKWREDKREGRVTRDNIEMAWAPVENPSRGQSGFGIVSLWFGLWRKIEGSRNRDSSVFARK